MGAEGFFAAADAVARHLYRCDVAIRGERSLRPESADHAAVVARALGKLAVVNAVDVLVSANDVRIDPGCRCRASIW